MVFASGVFDLLHPGHIRLLEQARALGDILVVGIPTDANVRAGTSQRTAVSAPVRSLPRPITPAAERAEILAAFEAVDYVAEFDEATLRQLLAGLLPDVVVRGGGKSSDAASLREDADAEAADMKIVRVPLEPGYSTTRLLERITQLRA